MSQPLFLLSAPRLRLRCQQGRVCACPSGATVLDYDYDALGQLTRQRDEQGQRYFSYDVTGKTTGVYLDAARQQPVVTFAYDDRGFRVSKTAYANGGAKTTYYVRDVAGNVLAVYEQPTASSPLQRSEVPLYGASRVGTLTRLPDGSEDYRYELNDHLGDARVVFHRPATTSDTEDLEAGVFTKFTPQGAVAVIAPSGGGHGGSTFAAELDGRQTPTLTRSITVQQGDTLTFTAWAKAVGGFTHRPAAASPTGLRPYLLLGAAATTEETPTRLPDGQLTRPQTGAGRWLGRLAVGLSITLPGKQRQLVPGAANRGTPYDAWLKYRVLDANGQPVAGQEQTVYLPSNGTNWQQLQLGVRVPQGGTVELSAASTEASSYVLFDDLTVEQTGGLIVQEQHQYAFGAPLPGLSYTVGNMRYRHGYQGQYAEKDAEIGFENFELRLYNSRIGRWMSYDPYGQFDSPYVGMGNDPVSGVDPDGGFTGPVYTLGNIAKNAQALGNVAITGSKAAMSVGLRLALQAGSSVMRVGNAYGQYANGLYSTMFNGVLGGAPDRTMELFGYRRSSPGSVPEAAGQFLGNVAVTGWGLLNTAVGGFGAGGGGVLSLSGIGATLGMPIAAAGAVDFAYGLTVTGTGYVGLINSGNAILNMAAEHTKGARPSTKGKHEKGQANKRQARGGEKGDANRSYPSKRPPNHKGPWPPKKK